MTDYDNRSDESLLESYRRGDQGVSDYLMEKYKGLVKRKARAFYLIGGETDDLIQEGMIGLFKAVRDYQPDRDTSFVTFARLCIERQIYSAIQNSNRQKNIPLNSYIPLTQEKDTDIMLASLDIHAQSPESIIISKENARFLYEMIKTRLSRMEVEVLERYLRGAGYAEIGQQMGKPAKSIDNAIQRIRKKIREYLEENRE